MTMLHPYWPYPSGHPNPPEQRGSDTRKQGSGTGLLLANVRSVADLQNLLANQTLAGGPSTKILTV